MTYDVPRWGASGRTGLPEIMPDGEWCKVADAEAHEKAAVAAAVQQKDDGSLDVETMRRLNAWAKGRDAGIRECIETLLSMPVQHWPYDEITDTYAECISVDSAVDALSDLMKGEE